MNDEQLIKRLADQYELPVEQVALIWNMVSYMDENYDVYFDGDYSEVVKGFIKSKMS